MKTSLQARAHPASIPASFTPGRTGLLRRKCACGGTPGVDGECAGCREKHLQRRAAQPIISSTAPPVVHEALSSPGQPLDASTRALMEPRFGHDFSQVKVHTGTKAAESAQAVDALAYTVGRDVVFGAGKYVPGTMAGKRLLAHELVHTIQQNNHIRQTAGELEVTRPVDAPEQEAANAARAILEEGRPVKITPRQTVEMSRQPSGESAGDVKNPREGLREASEFQDAYLYLNGLEINDLLNKLTLLKEAGYLGGLIKNIDVAAGIHRERLRAAMHAADLKGKVTPERFAEDFKDSLAKIEESGQREAIVRFVGQPAADVAKSVAPVAQPSGPAPGAFKTFAYKMSGQEVPIVKQREKQVVGQKGKEREIPGRVEIKESPAYFTAEVLKMAGLDPQAWFSSFTSISFLGVRVSDIHTDLAAHLKAVEQKFAEQYGGDQKDPVVAGKTLGLKQNIGGGREAPTGTAISMHLFGLAIDVNYDTNPWIGEESTLKAENEIIGRATVLVNGKETLFTLNTMSYDDIAALNQAMKTYFSYIDKRDLLETRLKDAKGIWAGMSTDAALKRVQADFNDLAVKWERKGAKQEAIKQGGFLDLTKELVEGMGLDWGGKYGDMSTSICATRVTARKWIEPGTSIRARRSRPASRSTRMSIHSNAVGNGGLSR